MGIPRNAGSDGGTMIKDAGEYRVKVIKTETGMSKSGKKMLTVSFQNREEKTIRAFFVGTVNFHMKALKELKLACGLKETDRADQLVGKECGILVEPQEPDPVTGRVFMSVNGYGKTSEVGGMGADPFGAESGSAQTPDDDIPF